MKKLLILTLLMILVACASAPQETTEEAMEDGDAMEGDAMKDGDSMEGDTMEAEVIEEITQEAKPPQPAVKVEEPVVEEEPGITKEAQERVELQMEIAGKRIAISDSYRKYELGELYVLSLGIKNLRVKEDDFKLVLTFDDARDSLGNLITSDGNLVAGWIGRNNFETFTLDDGETAYIPIFVETTQFIDGETPPKGKYTFDVNILNADGNPEPKEYYSKTEFIVHID